MKKVTYIEMPYHELDDLIEAHFELRPGSSELVPINEWNNYSNYTFDVEPKQLSESDAEDVKKAALKTHQPPEHKWSSGNCFDPGWVGTSALLNDMCFHGRLEAGEYLITVFW